ncbi:hydrophobin [Agaricus bisporus var. bisporus H97]|uniref:hydrophobin n=1 Tax=Agaricus bisporus var. bisporus (strain H97 / ATCC MYA-4626 / FGSC 10389) TaxID=936046 RepID=UPI00029F787C|nr:hydrophobin [Agaricus bisporus var. bisporus H97]EKV46978.1 hydrophobin [Agaricus bisporus var. bisporus H97]
MFARLSTVSTVLFFATFAAATAVPRTDKPTTGEECTAVGGDVNCCNSVSEVDDPAVKTIAGLLGIVLGPLDALIGLTCSGIDIIGGGTSCSSQTVCCTGNNFGGGLLVIGCSPINIDL